MADFEDIWPIFAPLLFAGALVGILGFSIAHSFQPDERKFRRLYAGLSIAPAKTPGCVLVRYSTYDGFLAWFVQTEHVGYLTPEQARRFLGRMLRYNLIWGTFCAGGLFVLVLTVFHYLAQQRAIERQEMEPNFEHAPEEPSDLTEFIE